MSQTVSIGRNEPCPCGSQKKYKRCCGVNAAPKLSIPRAALENPSGDLSGNPLGTPPGFDPKVLENMDPQWMSQVSQALQRLPKGQLQRLQSIMQKAMHGKDVTAEAEELEKSLPPEFQTMMQSWGSTFEALQSNTPGASSSSESVESVNFNEFAESTDSSGDFSESSEATSTTDMTLEQARELVAQAAKKGMISEEQAQSLLVGNSVKDKTGS